MELLIQQRLIADVRALCSTDPRLDAAMMYGSFAYGEADVWSDIEFLLFFDDDAFDNIEPHAWLSQLAPVAHLYVNEHGIVCVLFDIPGSGLIRGEFHVHRLSDVTIGESWRGVLTFPSLESTLIVDRSGRLAPYLEPIIGPPLPRDIPAQMQFIADGFVNWMLFGHNVLRRGEYARALEILTIIHRHLLHMARLVEGTTAHWLTPSRLLESDLSPDAYERFAACTAALDPDALRGAYRAAWAWGDELLVALHEQHGTGVPETLRTRFSDLFARL